MTKTKERYGTDGTIRIYTIDELIAINKGDWESQPLSDILARHIRFVEDTMCYYDGFEDRLRLDLKPLGLQLDGVDWNMYYRTHFATVSTTYVQPEGKLTYKKGDEFYEEFKDWKNRLDDLRQGNKKVYGGIKATSTSVGYDDHLVVQVSSGCQCGGCLRLRATLADVLGAVLNEIDDYVIGRITKDYEFTIHPDQCADNARDAEHRFLIDGHSAPHGVELDKTAKVC